MRPTTRTSYRRILDRARLLHEERRFHEIIIRTLIAVVLFWLDPAGISTQRSRYVDSSLAWLHANLFPHKVSEQIAVVLVNEADLDSEHFRMDWPFTYRKTADMIHAIACARAMGVFFDYTASSRHNLADGEEELEKAILDSSSGIKCDDGRQPSKIPVFFGRIDEIKTPLAEKLSKAHRAFRIEAGVDDALYPPSPTQLQKAPVETDDLSPAFAIIRLACATQMQAICDTARPPDLEPLRLLWSPLISEKQASVSEDVRPREGCRGPLSADETLVLFVQPNAPMRTEPCPPLLTLKGQDLYRNSMFIREHGNPVLALQDRFVFVGPNLAGLNDAVLSPVHGSVPGVYKHAVALDNLLTLERPYPTRPRPETFVVVATIIFLMMEAVRELARNAWLLRVAIVLVGACLWIVVFMNSWPVSAWLAIFGYYIGSDLLVRAGEKATQGTAPRKAHVP